jgi:hypothetical protein
MISPTSIVPSSKLLGYVGYYGDMRADRGVSVVLALVALALPSCLLNPGEVALRIGGADRVHVLWYPCSTNWNATEVRLYRLEGRFLGDGQDQLITSTNDIASTDGGEDSVVWNARLPMRERLGSGEDLGGALCEAGVVDAG